MNDGVGMFTAASSVVLCRCQRNDTLNQVTLRHHLLTMKIQVQLVRTRLISRTTHRT